MISHCKTASWRNGAEAKKHYKKHGKKHWGSQAAYNQAATDTIRRADRDVYLTVRGGRLKAMFVDKPKGKTARIAIVDVRDKELTTMHKRRKLKSDNNEVPPIKQPGRGIMKWITGLLPATLRHPRPLMNCSNSSDGST